MTKKKQIDVSWKTNSLISEQYQRTYRWLLRLKAYREGLPPSPDPTVAKDYLLSLATSCHSLRDWAKSDSEKWKIIEEYVEVDLFLKVCRDISNISKHKTLSRPSIDENIAILEARSPDQTYSIAVHFTNGTLIEAMRQSFKRAGKYDEQTFLNSLKKAKLDL